MAPEGCGTVGPSERPRSLSAALQPLLPEIAAARGVEIGSGFASDEDAECVAVALSPAAATSQVRRTVCGCCKPALEGLCLHTLQTLLKEEYMMAV